MAVAIVTSGITTSLAVSTETTICEISAAGVYQLNVVTSAMVTGDSLEIRIYARAVTGTSMHLAFYDTKSWYDADKLAVSPPYISTLNYVATLQQRSGTGRGYPFSVTQT